MYVNSSELAKLVGEARANGIAGIDTEFIRERTYYPKLALIQLVVDQTCVLIDPLDDIDLSPLETLMSDDQTLKVFHAGSQDLQIFYHLFKRTPQSVFDTQVAAAMIGLGAQLSLANLCDVMLGARLQKGESYTNWLARPLSDAQERYALEDVRYLLPLHQALLEKIDDLGRAHWLHEELEKFERAETFDPDPREAFWSVKRANQLDGRSLAILRELAAYRELTARNRDVPKRKVISDESLLEMARRRPQNPAALRQIRGLHPNEASRSGRDLNRVIQIGMKVKDSDCPRPKKRARLDKDQELVAHIAQAFVQLQCSHHEIDSTLVATHADIEQFVSEYAKGRSEDSNLSLMNGWRRDICGDALIELFEGRARLCINKKPFRGEIERD